jgi:glycosyltransferase involved in cell wall biosynthesis
MPPSTRQRRWLPLRRRQVPSVGVVDPGGAGPVPPSADIRVHTRLRHAEAAGLLRGERLTPDDPHDHEVLLVVRTGLPAATARATLDEARRRGQRVVVDLDDDLVSEHAAERLVARGWDPALLGAMREVVSAADQVLVSTPTLHDLVVPLNPRTSVVANALDPDLWLTPVAARTPKVDPDELRVLYMGSTTHGSDLALLDGLAAAVSARLDRKVVLEAVGVVVGPGVAGMRRVKIRNGDYPDFVPWLRAISSRWHAAVAPLEDTEFNRRKSDLKLLEYSLLGLPVVASRVGPYRDRDDWAVLCDNDADAWVEALSTLLADPDAAARQAAVARAATERDRVLDEANVRDWARLVLGTPTM